MKWPRIQSWLLCLCILHCKKLYKNASIPAFRHEDWAAFFYFCFGNIGLTLKIPLWWTLSLWTMIVAFPAWYFLLQFSVREVGLSYCLAQKSSKYWYHPVVLISLYEQLFSKDWPACHYYNLTWILLCPCSLLCRVLEMGLICKPDSCYLVRPS